MFVNAIIMQEVYCTVNCFIGIITGFSPLPLKDGVVLLSPVVSICLEVWMLVSG